MNLRLIAALALCACASAQTGVSNRTDLGAVDASGAVSTKPIKSGASLPATCGAGEFFNLTSATPGQNLYDCTSTNTWTLQSGGTVAGSNGDLQRNNSGSPGAANLNQQSDGSILASKAIDWKSCPAVTTAATTLTVDFSAANCSIITLVDSSSTLAVSNPHGSGLYALGSCQDPTGSRVWSAIASSLKGYAQPYPTLSTCTYQLFIYDGTNYQSVGSADCPLCAPFVGLAGSTSGLLSLKVAAIAGTNAFTFPAGTTDLSSTGGTSQVLKQVGSGAAITVGQLAASDLSNGTSGTGAVCLASGSSCGGAVGFSSPGSSHTFSGNADIFVCTTTCTITVPVPAGGLQYCVFNDDNVSTVITLSAIGSSARYENTARTAYGTAGTGTFVSGGAAGDAVCILGRDSTHYLTVSHVGTWVAN